MAPASYGRYLSRRGRGVILLTGFIGILFIVAIIATRDVFKWVLMGFYFNQMRTLEEELNARMDPTQPVFRLTRDWPAYQRAYYSPTYGALAILFGLVLAVLPSGVLYWRGDYVYLLAYLACYFVAIPIFLAAAKKGRRAVEDECGPTQL